VKRYLNAVYFACLISIVGGVGAFAFDLIGSYDITQTSDTAAKAKSEAMDIARRKILFDVLANYSEIDSLRELLDNTSDNDLLDFISASSVSNEHISSETYSATISMNIDNDAVKRWLTVNDVKNWVPLAENTESFSMFIVLPNGISDWGELKRITKNDNVDIDTVAIIGNQIFAKLPLNYRSKFTAALREMGWRYADNSGVLQVWK
jgi:hypothetical protein